MINEAMDVHVRNSFIKARDAGGRVLTQGRAGNSLLELAEKMAPVERAARADVGVSGGITGGGEKVRVVMEATTNSRAVASPPGALGPRGGHRPDHRRAGRAASAGDRREREQV